MDRTNKSVGRYAKCRFLRLTSNTGDGGPAPAMTGLCGQWVIVSAGWYKPYRGRSEAACRSVAGVVLTACVLAWALGPLPPTRIGPHLGLFGVAFAAYLAALAVSITGMVLLDRRLRRMNQHIRKSAPGCAGRFGSV